MKEEMRLLLPLLLALMAMNLNFGAKVDLNLQTIYQDVEAKLDQQLKLEMINGSTSSYFAKKRLNRL